MVSALGAAAVIGHWYIRRVDSLGRPRDKPWFSAGILVVVAVLAGAFSLRHRNEERRLSSVASALVGHSVRIKCQGYLGAFVDAEVEPGYVRFGASGQPEAKATIKADECAILRTYLASSKSHPTEAQVIAVHIVTHEAMHMRGLLGESAAECAAVQRDVRTAELLGASHDEALALARSYWTADYGRLPDDYRSAECGPGQSMDEHLPDPPWS